MPLKMRKSAAALCLAIAVFATIVSALDVMAPALARAAAWQLVPASTAVVIRREDAPSQEQTSPLLSLALSRPPPHSVLAP